MTDTVPAAAGGRSSVGMALRALLRADLVVLVKNRRALLLSLLLPLILLLATGSGRATGKLGGSLELVGLAISYGLAANGILGYGISVARDRDQGVLQRLRVTPTPTWALMGSRLAAQAVANLGVALVVLVLGTTVHHISVTPGQVVLVLAVSLLGSAVFLAVGQALVGLAPSAETVNAGGRILFGGLYFLGLFSSSGVLGGVWESISRWSPVGALMHLFAATLDISGWNTDDTLSVLACLGYVVVCAGVGIRWFRWEPK